MISKNKEVKLNDLICYIILNYPIPDEITASRISNILFLSDWISKIKRRKVISNINWMYNYDKLCTKEIKKQIEKNELIKLKLCIHSNRKYLILKSHKEFDIQKEELLILDKVIKIASKMYNCDLNSFTKNSYPLKNITSFSKVPFNRLRYKIYSYLNN